MTSAVLEARGVHRFFRRGEGEVAALKDVDLTVVAGETLAVVGPSGSGKSTLLSLLAGLDDPDGGSVWIAGKRISHQPAARQARLRGSHIGVLTQSSGLVEHLSVVANVQLASSLRPGRTMSADQSRELLGALGLGGRAEARPSTLSGGESARANLAVALAGGPRLLLADEPTAEVSRDEEDTVLALLRQARPADGATVLVTHSSAVADQADRIVEIRDGRLQ